MPEPRTFATYDEAYDAMPAGARHAATFGYPGDGGYRQHWSTPDANFIISNGAWDTYEPRVWTLQERQP